jgi:hypothetical protein
MKNDAMKLGKEAEDSLCVRRADAIKSDRRISSPLSLSLVLSLSCSAAVVVQRF